ncbi:MAG: RluA family pseudouridine synthase [Patescibacteria group bacterium]
MKKEYEILYEDKDILVVNKPAGLLVHKVEGKDEETLADLLVKDYPELKSVGDKPERPGIIHRLDKFVSGVMVVARTQEAFDFMKAQFKERRMKKEYIALVHGHMPRPVDTIKLKIARSREKARMVARPEGQEGRDAVTHYEVTDTFKNYDLLRVQIETGRTHQIRVHMHALGHPLVGDPLYKIKRIKSKELADRVFLHAAKLTLTMPSGETKTFEAPMPEELVNFLPTLART